MTVRIYRSTDTDAPILKGRAGTLIELLDACLVNGYTGKSAAGWTKPYTDTNKAVFRQAATGSGFYFRVDDSIGTFLYAYARGYETMSDVDTGVNPFPTVAQMANGIFFTKSLSNDDVARAWILIASEISFYLITNYASQATWTTSQGHFFGDIFSFKPGDAFNCMIIGASANAASSLASSIGYVTSAGIAAHYMARPYTGAVTPVNAGKVFDNAFNPYQTTPIGNASITYAQPLPNPVDGGLYLGRIHIYEPQVDSPPIRGYMPGMWALMHEETRTTFPNAAQFYGTGAYSSKLFESCNMQSTGQCIFEISDTWD